jgi:hypothetical protein
VREYYRRITQGSRSVTGQEWNAHIRTVPDTCRKKGRSARQLLQNGIYAYYVQARVCSLLPQAD